MPDSVYYVLCGICVAAVLLGINMMSKVKTAVQGNALSAAAMVLAIAMIYFSRVSATGIGIIIALWLALAAGAAAGIYGAAKAKMIDMPQIIALLNGFGGAASALVASVTAVNGASSVFDAVTAGLALTVGALTFTGSVVAAGKLARILDSRPKFLPKHSLITGILALGCVAAIVLQIFSGSWAIANAVLSLTLGVVFVMRVGGADMPITISLLNSLSGVAGGIAGMAINEPLLVAVGGIVGASGLILTQDMCKAMNRKLITILTGQTTAAPAAVAAAAPVEEAPAEPEKLTAEAVAAKLQEAKKVLIVPGYGMALSQAQEDVAKFAAALESRGAEVKFAIHPVAGRMPGHMSVLLCEADIDYDSLFMMDDINGEFASCDIAIVIGANDVTNPAANTAEGTPIYGMPVLNVADAPMTVFCNFDTKPGYAGVPNPLYDADNVLLMLGDAKESVRTLRGFLEGAVAEETPAEEAVPAASGKLTEQAVAAALQAARKVLIVPGYGMALSQAQEDVAKFAAALENRGTEVKFAIHPVAGRMPGHMSVLLCEADIDYEKLFMMEDINEEFASCDIAVVIGANDVTNPAANTAEGTPIYGMPVLNVVDAPMTVFCNFDTKPGYAGVPNPMYEADNVLLMLGDAKESVRKLQGFLEGTAAAAVEAAPAASGKLTAEAVAAALQAARKVLIVPGYGMALSQAQENVAKLAAALESRGAEVKFAIHPVAGRMPGHMSVLLCEADIDYEKLFMMEDINGEFASCDIAIVIGANDVTNPAANTAEGTPIYGMPVLNVVEAPMTVFCNFDTKPGYAGVPNPMYEADNVLLMLGDAKESVDTLLGYVK